MATSEKAKLVAGTRARVKRGRALVDVGCQLVVCRRDPKLEADRRRPHGGVPDYLLPRIYGGLYSPRLRSYIGPPRKVQWLTCNPVQRDILRALEDRDRVLLLGAPGASKTESAVIQAVLNVAMYPAVPGIVVAPVAQKKNIFWNAFLARLNAIGWVKDIFPASRDKPPSILCINDAEVIFVAAKKQSKASTSPIAGFNAWWAIEDEQQGMDDEATFEVDARGRANPDGFRVVSSATNLNDFPFQKRIQFYERSPKHAVIRMSGYKNVFVKLSHWERLRGKASPEDFDRIVNCLDVPSEGRVTPRFAMGRDGNVRPMPAVFTDLTPQLTAKAKLVHPTSGKGFPNVVGLDPGRLVCAAGVLKAIFDPTAAQAQWWVTHEFRTVGKTIDWIARDMLAHFDGDPTKFIVLVDPHANGKETSGSDYSTLTTLGINWMRAHYTTIDKKMSISMVNGLLCNSLHQRRLFIAEDPRTLEPVAPRLSETLMFLKYGPSGEPENEGKTDKDLTHSLDWLRYGLHKFEDDVGLIAITGAKAKG